MDPLDPTFPPPAPVPQHPQEGMGETLMDGLDVVSEVVDVGDVVPDGVVETVAETGSSLLGAAGDLLGSLFD